MLNSKASSSDVARLERWVGRQALRSVTTDIRCVDCGREPVGKSVGLRLTGNLENLVSGFSGLSSCGRIWLCPVCNAKVMATRALEIAVVLAWAERLGLHVLFGSLTVRHNSASDLRDLLNMQRFAWAYVTGGRVWGSQSATVTVEGEHSPKCSPICDTKHRRTVDGGGDGRVGYIRASEVTIGVNGWHPHFHPIVLVRGSKRFAHTVAASLVQEWIHGVEKFGGEARAEGGQQMRVLGPETAFENIVGYVTKQTYSRSQRLALEAVWSQGKKSRGRAHSTAPHWVLLEDVAAGDYTRISRWDELETAMRQHRMITWSRGLRDFAGIGDEVEDEVIAGQEAGSAEDTVCFITPEGWNAIRDNPEQLVGYLEILRRCGWPVLRELFILDGIDFFELEMAEA